MRRSGLVLVTAVATTAGLLTAPSASATACTPSIVSAAASDAVITPTGKAASRVTVRAADSCNNSYYYGQPGVWGVSVTAYNPGRDVATGGLNLTAGTYRDGTWTGYLQFSSKDSIGTWYLDVTASDSDGQATSVREATMRLRRNTRVSLDARPEPVGRGDTLRLRGHVSKLTAKLAYADLRDAPVRIYFQRAGRSAKVLVTRTRTARDGRYAVAVTARRTGRWYAWFPGNFANTSRWSSADLVRIG